ncbi:hypothetical protein [Streptomyces sp. VRA16 Mangrove soil]|uniref:hypothetical protein n=1 Tax=Streptomyces sp. VRA16 Mangrove soil TaxID=2817434 RepID=UPI001A9E3CED|nr:hypothetical protein [Streptomyces sp. VRA16 Mangrove soil]MBO1333438.1 hypothetical protein [Streptomyces sp. VRA16 Mangrove soil]
MAKNRKQNRNQQQKSAQAQEQARSSAMEAEAKSAVQATPGDVARKHRERRFGHN